MNRGQIAFEFKEWQDKLATKYPEGLPTDDWKQEDEDFVDEDFIKSKGLEDTIINKLKENRPCDHEYLEREIRTAIKEVLAHE